MRRSLLLSALAVLALAGSVAAQNQTTFTTACLAGQNDPDIPEYEACSCLMNDEVDPYKPEQDYFEHKVSSGNPQYWRIQYTNSYKVITNMRDAETYVLYLCSTPKPPPSLFPSTAKFFQIPLQRVLVGDDGLLAFFSRLGLLPAIAHVPDPSDLAGSCGQRLVEMGRITGIPYTDGLNESLVDAAFVTDGDLLNRTATNGSGKTVVPNSKAIRIPIREDPNPIARMEYLLFLAAFWNLEEKALTTWQLGVSQYQCNVNQIKMTVLKRPIVAWLRREKDGFFTTPEHPYRTALLLAAGANAMIAQQPVSLADVQKGLLGADAIIDETDGALTFGDFLANYMLNVSSIGGKTGYRFLDERRVWRTDKIKPSINSFSSGFDQLSLATPDVVLADLIAVLYPSYNPGLTSRWFRNIALGEQVLANSPLTCQTTAQVSAAGPNIPRDLCPSTPFPNGNPWGTATPSSGGSSGNNGGSTGNSGSDVSEVGSPGPVTQPVQSQPSTSRVVALSVGITLGVTLLVVAGILTWGHVKHGWFSKKSGGPGNDGNGKFVRMDDDFVGAAERRGTKIPEARTERSDSTITLA